MIFAFFFYFWCQMRALIFFISLCTFLLAGGHQAVANTQQLIKVTSAPHFEKSKQSKYSNSDPGFTLIDDADIDLTEESHLSNNLKNDVANKFLTGKYNFLKSSHTSNSSAALVSSEFRNCNISPRFCAHSPIYISQRVLRL